MGCWRYREALSARLDGEASPVAEEELAAHLASCPACARWLARAERVTRLARVGPAEAQPDLAAQVLRAAGGPGPGRPRWWRAAGTLSRSSLRLKGRRAGRVGLAARWGLFAVGCAQLAVWSPNLLYGDDRMVAAAHVAREIGVFNTALAVGFLALVARPHRAAGLLPVLAAAVGLLAVVEVRDLVEGHVHAERLVTHLLLALGLVLVALLARGYPGWTAPAPAARGPGPAPPAHGGPGSPFQSNPIRSAPEAGGGASARAGAA